MYQLFPSYESFVLFSITLLVLALLSLLFRRQLNAIEDSIRDSIEMKLKERKNVRKQALRHIEPEHAKHSVPGKTVTVTISRSENIAA